MQQLIIILRQVIFIAPILWILELFQNWLHFLATGKWGWVYPGSEYHWFSFQTLGNWALSVVVIYLVYRLWFNPKKTNTLLRIFIVGIMGLVLEWCNGFLFFQFTGNHLFIWESSSFLYIDYIAMPMWWFNAAVYHFLSMKLINLHE